MGPAKFVQLKAVLEMARRCMQDQLSQPGDLNKPEEFAQFARLQIGLENIEKFLAIGLDSQLKILAHGVLSSGTLNKTVVYPREVLKFAIENNASRVIIAHNHPSGSCEPSAADDLMTDRLKNALFLVDIELVDHLIVSRQGSFSYRQSRREPF